MMVARRTCEAFSVCLTLLMAACSGSQPAAPTPSATITAVSIIAPTGPMKRGATLRLVATVSYADGRSGTTQSLTWTTSDAGVATVDASGLVTAMADGTVTITASSGSVSGTALILVRSGGFTLAGVVTQSAPTESERVAGARVVVAGGVYDGTAAVTDAAGAFSLADVNGSLTLRVSAPDFEETTATADVADAAVTIRLTPAFRMLTDSIEWLRPAPGVLRDQGVLNFVMHHGGTVDLTSEASIYYSDTAATCTEVRDESNAVLWRKSSGWQMPVRASVSLAGGKKYELKVFECDASRPTLIWYKLTVVHPS
jgi:hypothetical protein